MQFCLNSAVLVKILPAFTVETASAIQHYIVKNPNIGKFSVKPIVSTTAKIAQQSAYLSTIDYQKTK